MLTIVGVDIGLNNLALEVIGVERVPTLHDPCNTVKEIAHLPWHHLHGQNLQLGAHTVGEAVSVLFYRLTTFNWAGWIRRADVIIIELQNGRFSPQNQAIQAAMQMYVYTIRGHNSNCFLINNARKLHTMALYKLIPERVSATRKKRKAVATATTTSGKKTTTKRNQPQEEEAAVVRPPSHHQNKKDVVDYFRREHPGVVQAFAAETSGDKLDDRADALSHALCWWWEQMESASLQKALRRTRAAASRKNAIVLTDTRRAELHAELHVQRPVAVAAERAGTIDSHFRSRTDAVPAASSSLLPSSADPHPCDPPTAPLQEAKCSDAPVHCAAP